MGLCLDSRCQQLYSGFNFLSVFNYITFRTQYLLLKARFYEVVGDKIDKNSCSFFLFSFCFFPWDVQPNILCYSRTIFAYCLSSSLECQLLEGRSIVLFTGASQVPGTVLGTHSHLVNIFSKKIPARSISPTLELVSQILNDSGVISENCRALGWCSSHRDCVLEQQQRDRHWGLGAPSSCISSCRQVLTTSCMQEKCVWGIRLRALEKQEC